MNDQLVVTVFFAFVIACVVSLIALTRKEEVYKTVSEDEKSQLQKEAESMVTGTIVVEPETETKAGPEDTKAHPRFVPEGMVLPTGAEDEMDIEKTNMKMPEFKGKIALSSGRVKDDFDKDKIKMPKEEIKRAHPTKHIDRNRLKDKVRPEEIKRDDFDLPYKEGDDFDI